MKVVLTGGGTAGHVFPAISVGQQLKEQYGVELAYIGNAKYIEAKIAMDHHIPFYSISSKGLEGATPLSKYTAFAYRNTKGIAQAIHLLRKIKPDFVLATGGFVSAPVLAACQVLRIPYSIHEQNSVLGKVNRLFAKKARHTFYSFPVTEEDGVRYSGIPLRFTQRLHANGDRIVFVGGSGGSAYLNEHALHFAHTHPDIPCTLVTGKMLYEACQKEAETLHLSNLVLIPYAEDMLTLYKSATIIVCRSGAGTIFEIANLGIPAIFVPLPTSADDHQKKNALFFEQQGAAKVIEQGSHFDQALASELITWWENEQERTKIKERLETLAVRDSAQRICDTLMAPYMQHATQKQGK